MHDLAVVHPVSRVERNELACIWAKGLGTFALVFTTPASACGLLTCFARPCNIIQVFAFNRKVTRGLHQEGLCTLVYRCLQKPKSKAILLQARCSMPLPWQPLFWKV